MGKEFQFSSPSHSHRVSVGIPMGIPMGIHKEFQDSHGKICGNSHGKTCENSHGKICGNSHGKTCGNSHRINTIPIPKATLLPGLRVTPGISSGPPGHVRVPGWFPFRIRGTYFDDPLVSLLTRIISVLGHKHKHKQQ